MATPKLADQLLDLGRDAPGMVMDLVAAVLQPRDAFLPVAHQPRVHALAADPIPFGDLGHRNTDATSSTARYLCSATLNSHSMSGSVKHQAKPKCQASSGTAH